MWFWHIGQYSDLLSSQSNYLEPSRKLSIFLVLFSDMSLLDVTGEIENQSVILSRSITKLDDVYSFIDLVEEKLCLNINLTLILFGSDNGSDAKIEDNSDFKTEVEAWNFVLDLIHRSLQ